MAGISASIELYDKMSAPLNSIMKAVNLTNSAIREMGGSIDGLDAATFKGIDNAVLEANTELQMMNEYIAQNTTAEKGFNDVVETGTAGMNSLEGAVQKVVTAIGGMFAIQKVVGFIKDCTEAAATQNAAETQLATTLVNMGGNEDDYDAIVQKAQEIQKAGMYGDEAMIGAAAEFATYMSDTSAVEMMMDTLTDYAAGMSGGGAIDYDSMVNYATNLGKITTGAYDAMTKKGFEFTDAQKAVIDGSATQAQYLSVLGEGWEDMSEDMRSAVVISDIINESWNGMYESLSNTPEGTLVSIKNAFGDIQEMVGNKLNVSLGKLYAIIADNWSTVEKIMNSAADTLGVIISIVAKLLGVIMSVADASMSVASVISDNWSFIVPVIMAVVEALAFYNAYLGIVKIAEMAGVASKVALCLASYAHAAATGAEVSATAAATAAQYGFNTALLACPLTWIIAIIIAVIALLYVVIAAINKVAGTTYSATGVICGVISWAVALVKNMFVTLWNFIVDIVVTLENLFSSFADFFINVWTHPINAVCVLFFDFADTVLGILEAIASAIDTIFGSNLSGTVKGWRDSLSDWVEDTYEVTVTSEKVTGDSLKLDRTDMTDAYMSGYEFGKDIDTDIASMFEIPEIDFGGKSFDWDSLGSDVSDIASDTSDIKSSVDISDENLKYLRDIAEADAINRFTTAEISVSMTNNNSVSSGMDIDGVVGSLSAGVLEAMQQAAEGVH